MAIPVHMLSAVKTSGGSAGAGGGNGASSSSMGAGAAASLTAVAASLRLRRRRPGVVEANSSGDTNSNSHLVAWRNQFSPPKRGHPKPASEAEESEGDTSAGGTSSPALRPAAMLRSLTSVGTGAPPQMYLPPRHHHGHGRHYRHMHRDLSVPETTPLDAISLESAPHVAVRYGDTIRLFARSKYVGGSNAGGYVGTFEAERRLFKSSKNPPKHGELACLPPVLGSQYRPSAFTILSTTGVDVGSPVSYGDVLVLVDDKGRVWNNKIGVGPTTLNGYFGPRDQNSPGEMYLSFYQLTDDDDDDGDSSSDSDSDTGGGSDLNFLSLSSLARTTKSMAETTFGKPTQVEMDLAAAALRTMGRVVYYGDKNVIIDVADSNRLRSKFNRVVTHFRKNDELAAQGGYLRCDGRGKAIMFELHGQPLSSVVSIDVCNPEPRDDDDGDLTADDESQQESGDDVISTVETPTLRVASSGGSIAVGRPLEIRDAQPTSVVSLLFSDGGMLKIPCSRFVEAGEEPFYRIVLGGRRPLRLRLHAVKSSFRRKSKVSIRKTLRETYQDLVMLYSGVVVVSSAAAFVLSKVLSLRISLPAMYLGGVTVFFVFLLELYYPGKVFKSHEPEQIAQLDAGSSATTASVECLGDWRLSILAIEASATERQECVQSTPCASLTQKQSCRALRVPKSFVLAENGDVAKASDRYEVTLAWRKEMNADAVLDVPQTHYSTIKQHYHQYLHKTDRLGHPVYFEKIGNLNMKGLQKEGITQDDLFRHYLFAMEFTLKYAANKMCHCDACAPSETHKLFIVLDARGIGMKDLSGDGADFIRRCTGIMQRHYPQRSYKIFFVNVPSWFGMAWKGIKPLLNETTRAKTNILTESETPHALLEHIDAENLPVEYGGSCCCPGGCEENSAYQRLQKKLVDSVISCRPFAPEDIAEGVLEERTSLDGGLDSDADGSKLRDSTSSAGMTELSSTVGISTGCGGTEEVSLVPAGLFREEVLHAGYLLKRPMKHNHFTPIWNRRFFILHPDSLRFGKVPRAEVYQIVQLTAATIVRKTQKGTNTFELVTPLMAKSGHSLILYAPTLAALNKWVDAIQQAVDKLSGKPTGKPTPTSAAVVAVATTGESDGGALPAAMVAGSGAKQLE